MRQMRESRDEEPLSARLDRQEAQAAGVERFDGCVLYQAVGSGDEVYVKAPFPYFGGKTKVAADVWAALGDCKHYIEPFFGSGAVLLSRPEKHVSKMETINDKDGFVANVWRSLQLSPDETARWCDWPVNHADLIARKTTLIKNESMLLENLCKDDVWHDPKLAGFWIWAASCWIGSGLTIPNQIPHVSNGGKGVHAMDQIPHVSNGGKGVHAMGQIPHVSNGGKGVHAMGQIPHVSNSGMGVTEPYKTTIFQHFRQLSERLRYVRVVCGEWHRVCGGNWQNKCGTCGIFFDPPYSHDNRRVDIYQHDSESVASEVLTWCIDRGSLPDYRIVLAGYSEHDALASHGWRKQKWVTNGGFANTGRSDSQGKINKTKETLWFSPHCLNVKHTQQTKFNLQDLNLLVKAEGE